MQQMHNADDRYELIIVASTTQETYHSVEKKFYSGVDESFRFPKWLKAMLVMNIIFLHSWRYISTQESSDL